MKAILYIYNLTLFFKKIYEGNDMIQIVLCLLYKFGGKENRLIYGLTYMANYVVNI